MLLGEARVPAWHWGLGMNSWNRRGEKMGKACMLLVCEWCDWDWDLEEWRVGVGPHWGQSIHQM